jgi:rRNA-processing protein FCF1
MASEYRPSVLLDANVIFSGFRGTGPPSQIIRLAAEAFSLLVTDEVINEVLRNIARKAPLVLVEVEEWFESVAVQVWEVLPDAIREYEDAFGKDAHIVAAAIAVRPDYVCTGDGALRDGLNALSEAPTALSPRELLDLLTL